MERQYKVYGKDCFTHIFILGELYQGIYISRVLNKDIELTENTIIENSIYIIIGEEDKETNKIKVVDICSGLYYSFSKETPVVVRDMCIRPLDDWWAGKVGQYRNHKVEELNRSERIFTGHYCITSDLYEEVTT